MRDKEARGRPSVTRKKYAKRVSSAASSGVQVKQAGRAIERLFGAELSVGDWNRLREVLEEAREGDRHSVIEFQSRFSEFLLAARASTNASKRKLIADLAGLCRLSQARALARWLEGVMARMTRD